MKTVQNQKFGKLSANSVQASGEAKNVSRFMTVVGEVKKSMSGSMKDLCSRMHTTACVSTGMHLDTDMRALQVDLERNINQFGRGASCELSDMEAHYQRTAARFF